MRRIDWLAGLVALLAGGAAAGLGACFSAGTDDCSKYPEDGVCKGWGTSSSSGTTGTGGQPPLKCEGAPNAMNDVEQCAVFVAPPSAADAGPGEGTPTSPYTSLQKAIQSAGSKAKVYACKGSFDETVKISSKVEVYGGFDCSQMPWGLPPANPTPMQMTALTTAPGSVPLTVATGAAGTVVSGFAITSGSLSGMTTGASSIAMVVDANVSLESSALTAGDASDGAAGTSPAADPTLDGATGKSGADTCSAGGTHTGGAGQTNMCPDGNSSMSGKGGDGGDSMGDPAGSGANGSASPIAMPVGTADGKGGLGEGQPTAPVCVNGDTGAPGAVGGSGTGATGAGTITAGSYQGAPGVDGKGGDPGEGGGGGGGAKGLASGMCNGSTVTNLAGASGGGGGTGGCGGKGGSAGQPGGSSIALLVFNADVTLTNVTLAAGKGGTGGDGGSGQSGGAGGNGGPNGAGGPADAACSVGNGGKGGNGGPGGGGQGGHSLGIAFKGTAAPKGGTFMITPTNKGSGGSGGMNNTAANNGQGADGMAANCWDFGKNAACN
jgi:hypothetical protein